MSSNLVDIFDKMKDDPKIGFSVKGFTSNVFIKRKNIKERNGLPSFFISKDILENYSSYQSFIDQLLKDHGSIVINPHKWDGGNGLKKVDGLKRILVDNNDTNKNEQKNTQEPIMNELQQTKHISGNFGMGYAEMVDMATKASRNDELKLQIQEYKHKIDLIENKLERAETKYKEDLNTTEKKLKDDIDLLVSEKRSLTTKLDSIQTRHELEILKLEISQAKGFNSPAVAKLLEVGAPLMAKFASGNNNSSVVNEMPGMAGIIDEDKSVYDAKVNLIKIIATTKMDLAVVDVLSTVGELLGNEAFVMELSTVIDNHS
jgi:hypothetical protein